MVSSCCIVNCKNHRIRTKSLHLRYYRIPKSDKQRRAKWLEAIGRSGWQPSPFSRVCSDHFVFGEKSDNTLSPNYVPCIFNDTTLAEKKRLQRLFDIHSKQIVERVGKIEVATSLMAHLSEVNETSAERGSSLDQRKTNVVDDSAVFIKDEFPKYSSDVQESDNNVKLELRKNQDTQTLLMDSYLKSLEDEYYKLKNDLSFLKEKDVFRDMRVSMFEGNDARVRCLTGLTSYDMLKVLTDFLSRFQSDLGKLSKFQQLMVTLVKIKLNLPMPFLAILFNISLTTVSRSFRLTIELLFKKVVPLLVFWPSMEDMQQLIPPDFEDCENCLYSVDYFELNVEVRGCTGKDIKEDSFDTYYSSVFPDIRKRKYFMSVAPQGSVIFISQGSSGDVGERFLAIDSGFFEHVYPEDVVLSDRPLDIEREIDDREANFEQTCDLKDDITKIVTVERVLKSMKKRFQILEDTILRNWGKDFDKDGYCTCDKIVKIVCALFNMTNKDWNYRKCLMSK